MSAPAVQGDAISPPAQTLGGRARSGTVWLVGGFGFAQILRLGTNIALAALLFEEAFALMALVSAVMMGLAMFSDIGLQQNVIQSSRGDESDFLNTAWTMQVIRGVMLTMLGALLAWPLAIFYGANDPAALELRWLIPLVALTAMFDGLRSPRMLSAARHMQVAQLTRIEMCVTVVHAVVMLGLAWYTRSVYALAIAGVLSSSLHAAMTFWCLPGPRARFILEPAAVRSVFSFGKWIFLSTLISFMAVQIDRLTFAAMYPLAEVGVYSIAAGLGMMVMMLVGRLQSAIVFPWYARMLENGMELSEAFHRAKMPALLLSTYLVTLLIVGAGSFFSLAYDPRYSQAAIFLPILAVGAWFSTIGGMYGSAFLAKGKPNWIALVSAVKVLSFLIFLGVLSMLESTLVMATFAVLLSEVVTMFVGRYLGWQLGLKNMKVELGMLVMLVGSSGFGLLLVRGFEPLARLHAALQLILLGVVVTILFAPFFLRMLIPILKQRVA